MISHQQRWLLIGALIFSRVVALLVLHIYDDAFITFRTAENLANGVGFVFNPGEDIMGLTCPAFGLLQAGIAVIGLPLPLTVPILNILLDVAIALLIMRLFSNVTHGPKLSILTIALFTLSPSLVRTTVGGMEMNLFACLSLVAIYLFQARRTNLAILVASINYFVRPEAVILVGVLLLCEWMWHSKRRAFILALISLVTVAPGLLALQLLYGSFLPQSVTAKATTESGTIVVVLTRLFLSDPVHLALLPFALIGVLEYWKRKERVFTILGTWFVLYVGAYVFSRPSVWSWYGFAPRLVQLVFAALGFIWLLQSRPLQRLWPALTASRLTFATVILTALVYTGVFVVAYPSKVTANVYAPMQAWGRSIPPNETILADDIGAVGFYTRSKIYDTFGLVWPEAVGKSIHDLILLSKPDHIVLSALKKHKALMDTSIFSTDYTLRHYWMKTPRDTAEALHSLEDEWVQEYFVYSKK